MTNFKTFDEQNLLEHFNGDEAILLDMISMFQKNLDKLLSSIRSSIFNRDSMQLKINAHTFKGVLSNFYAEEGRQLAYELEVRGQHAKFDDCLDVLNKLENVLLQLLFELNFFKKNLDQFA